MEDSIIERIKVLINIKSKSSRAFANNIGFSYSTLNNYLLGKRTTIDSDLLCKIISTYSDINGDWLLTGKSSMLKNISENSENLLKQSENDSRNSIDELVTNKINDAVMENLDKLVDIVMKRTNEQIDSQNKHMRDVLKLQSEENAKKI